MERHPDVLEGEAAAARKEAMARCSELMLHLRGSMSYSVRNAGVAVEVFGLWFVLVISD